MRIETDSLGPVEVPDQALWGAQTQRAIANFCFSGLVPFSSYVQATALVKQAAANVNTRLGLLDPQLGGAIAETASAIARGEYADQFVVDPYQAGAGTSHNMNLNEVIANLANRELGAALGSYKPIHPNDHVNMAQSTNDVIPTATRIALALQLPQLLLAIDEMTHGLEAKAAEFDDVLKAGRTHLQDAVPVRLGQEFGAYAAALRHDRERLNNALAHVRRLGIGGTATGTGLNSHPRYHSEMITELSAITGVPFKSAGNLFEAMQNAAGDLLEVSTSLRSLAVSLTRINNDLRLLSSGPSNGLAEITLPALQPGSSIMPGKVNPVMPEAITMVCFRVIGNDQTALMAAQAGQLELNVFVPVLAHVTLESLQLLTNGVRSFTALCLLGIGVNRAHCQSYAERTSSLVTALNPYIGYAAAAKVAQESLSRGVSIRQVVFEHHLMTPDQLDEVLNLRDMTEPGIPG
ncbi:MAG: aspartate ammonia-lyase [Chloroflexi bacterium]|nr:aspartate ammonia-lyase [Chloroflexota bacterium]